MDVEEFLNGIRSSPDYAGQMVYAREVAAREARFGDPAEPLGGPIRALLASRGIERLYAHQAAAIDAARRGEDVLVATGTASGKSLCYVIPILERLLEEPDATALLLFPTKALCQDQYRNFARALPTAGIGDLVAGVYDGDTPASLRRRLRDRASVIFSNPDMLHAAVMPQHGRWARFLCELRLLVLDELHVYNGMFGSNTANLLRRFWRICEHYGGHTNQRGSEPTVANGRQECLPHREGGQAAPKHGADAPFTRSRRGWARVPGPQVIACSATIGNPKQLGERLIGRRMTLVDDDGSPRGRRTYVFWNPPRVRSGHWRSRRSANVEAHELMAMLVQRGVPTITFSKAKMTAEMIHRYVCDRLGELAPPLVDKVRPYRGGYLPEERREIERKLFSGELLGVSTTRALELGIDVGGLDASIVVGYPGTLASFFQQSGRAGRQDRDALVVLIGLDTAVNQYVMSQPDYIFGRPVEQAVIDPDNPFVVSGHLRCATHERPLADGELDTFGPYAKTVLDVLRDNLKVDHIEGKWYHAAPETPQHETGLRNCSDATVVIEGVDSGAVLGRIDQFDAPPIVHPGAIYMHQGDTYRVLELDLEEKRLARVKRVDVDYYTQPMGGSDVHHIDHPLRQKPFGTGTAFWGEVTAYDRTWGYEKIRFYELDAVSRHPVDLPTLQLETMAFWIVPPEGLMERLKRAGLDAHSGLRGIGYATRILLPLFITCDTLDFSHSVGSVNSPWNAVFVYERYPHGLGFTEKAYDLLAAILPAVLEHIRRCPCAEGCPCCVGKPLRMYATWNVERHEASIPSKAAARMILDGLLGDRSNLDQPDAVSLTDSDADDELRLEQALRRRLERLREPTVFHPIEPKIRTGHPEIARPDELAGADSARRRTGRRDFQKDLRRRLARKISDGKLSPKAPRPGPPPGTRKPGSSRKPTDFPGRPSARKEAVEDGTPPEPKTMIHLGDSLAARARRRKKGGQ
ncbi:MAG: DEAD/DEAH box helicase [Planctomycetota bacterium]